MKIEFNKVTWYSKLAAAVVLLIGVPVLTFYIGRKYEEVMILDSMRVVAVVPHVTNKIPVVTASMTDPLNGTYSIDDQRVPFVDGSAKVIADGTENDFKIFGKPVYGDLNGDGKSDAIFYVTEETEGTGFFVYVVGATNDGAGGYRPTDAIFIGDRISPQNITTTGGKAAVNYVDRKDGEPMAAEPTVGKTKYFTIQGGKLISP